MNTNKEQPEPGKEWILHFLNEEGKFREAAGTLPAVINALLDDDVSIEEFEISVGYKISKEQFFKGVVIDGPLDLVDDQEQVQKLRQLCLGGDDNGQGEQRRNGDQQGDSQRPGGDQASGRGRSPTRAEDEGRENAGDDQGAEGH